MSEFWDLQPSSEAAFVLPDGTRIDYARLAGDVSRFKQRLSTGKGILGLQCPGHYRQYVAYLAALQANCPVALLAPGQTADELNLTLSYHYDPQNDVLAVLRPQTPPALHPDLAVLLSTSGSTGSSKWVRLSYGNIHANACSIAAYLGLTSDDRAPMALPFQYSYGMSVLNSHLAVGGTLVLTEGSVLDPGFWALFEQVGCTSLAGVPHTFDLLDQGKLRTDHLRQLRYITQAGGRLAPSRVRAWAARGQTEGWSFVVMYGQTEAAPRISYLPPEKAAETPSAIGIPVPGGEMWVADEDGNRLPAGQQGELVYRGPNTMMGYALGDADLAKGQGSDILKTGDIAQCLENGMFEIVGRASRFVKIFGYRVGLDEVEKHLAETGVEAVCAAQGDRMYILLPRSGDGDAPVDRVAGEISSWLDIPAQAFQVEQVDAIPRKDNGKVDNPAVAALVATLAARTAAGARAKPARGGGGLSGLLKRQPKSVAEVFGRHFSSARLSPDMTFRDLGGDSLNYLSVALDLEDILETLPDDWTSLTIAELQSRTGERSRLARIDTPTLVRALAIMLIVMGHFHLFQYGGGGARSLFMVMGWSFAIFILPQILQREDVAPILLLGLRVALLTFGFTMLNYLVTGYGQWQAFVFLGNWFSPDIEGSAWFIEVYLQLFVVLAAVLSLAAVRDRLRADPFLWIVGAAAFFVGVAALSDLLVDTGHLFRRLPHLMAWIFLAGMAAALAQTLRQRGVVTLIYLAGLWVFQGLAWHGIHLFLFAALALIWVPALPVPRLALKPLRMIAGASLFIYLTHFQFAILARKAGIDSALISWVVAICGGVLLWRLYDPIDTWITRHLGRGLGMAPKDERSVSG